MGKIIKPLTDAQVKKSKAKEKDYELADGNGLYLRVRKTGNKSWIFRYTRPFTKKRNNMVLGPYPEITLVNARALREEHKQSLSQNIDPQEKRDDDNLRALHDNNTTFRFVAEKWFEVKRHTVSKGYAVDIWRSLENHVFPDIGHRPISSLNAPLVIRVLEPLAARGVLEQIRRLIQRINEIMIYALNTGMVQSNPLAGIRSAFKSPKRKNFSTIEPERLPELMEKLSRASIKYTTRILIEWQLHTMCRPSEAAAAKWEEIDFNNKLWIIPAERMKMNREHKIPLTDQTLKLLELMKPVSGHREYIFPADRNPRTHINAQTANMAIKRMGLKGELVAHGMRALASTILNDKGFDPDLIETALAHVEKNEVRRAYNRAEYIDRRREMMEWWSECIRTPENHFDFTSKL